MRNGPAGLGGALQREHSTAQQPVGSAQGSQFSNSSDSKLEERQRDPHD